MDHPLSKYADWTFQNDIDFVVASVGRLWTSLTGARFFITGGTGFIGRWILESLHEANQRHGLGVSAVVLSRNPERLRRNFSHLLSYPEVDFLRGDIRDFRLPTGDFTHVIHAATDASEYINKSDPKLMFDTILEGTRRVLSFAAERSVHRFLFLSSGAVYGRQPWDVEYVDEDWIGSPTCTDPQSAYSEGKRAAEVLCAIYADQFQLQISIARIFALLGPNLDLTIHFAAGNFIRDAIEGRPVVVKGSGLPVRSYLYASDMTSWLWHLLIAAPSMRPYNVGSDESITILDLATRISRLLGVGDLMVMNGTDNGWNLGRYVPRVSRIRSELGVAQTVSLDEAIIRTALWNGWNRNSV